jgi:hypothetical protein
MSYAAFGERRKGDWRTSDPLLPIIPDVQVMDLLPFLVMLPLAS